MLRAEWWENDGGFFGEGYMLGDNSAEGYIPDRKETLAERTRREVDGVERVLRLASGASVVDCPCGYGRHSIELANRGYRVTGADVNEQHLGKAREHAAKRPDANKGSLRFIARDMRNLSDGLVEPVDAVINMFYSFGFFRDEADNLRTMCAFRKSLKTGGALLLHTDVSPEMFSAKHYRLKEVRSLPDGWQLEIQERYDPETKRMEGTWTLTRGAEKRQLTPYSVRLYTADEFRDLAAKAGFESVEIYGGFDRSPFTAESREMVVVARR